jgi:hypothetical protein
VLLTLLCEDSYMPLNMKRLSLTVMTGWEDLARGLTKLEGSRD